MKAAVPPLQFTFVYVNGYVSVVTIKVQFEDDGDFEYELYNKKVILNDENVKVVGTNRLRQRCRQPPLLVFPRTTWHQV